LSPYSLLSFEKCKSSIDGSGENAIGEIK